MEASLAILPQDLRRSLLANVRWSRRGSDEGERLQDRWLVVELWEQKSCVDFSGCMFRVHSRSIICSQGDDSRGGPRGSEATGQDSFFFSMPTCNGLALRKYQSRGLKFRLCILQVSTALIVPLLRGILKDSQSLLATLALTTRTQCAHDWNTHASAIAFYGYGALQHFTTRALFAPRHIMHLPDREKQCVP